MKMTRLGISDCLLASAIFFLAILSLWVPVVLLTGYVLLFESNRWLRVSAVKALAILIIFQLVATVIGFIPASLTMMGGFLSIFAAIFGIFTGIFSLTVAVMRVLQMILLLLLAVKALKRETIGLGPLDDLIAKHMPKEKDPTTQ